MNAQKKTIGLRVVVAMLFFVVGVPMLPLILSGRWGWPEAWAYAVVCVVGFAASRALAARRNPDLLAERARFLQHDDAKRWDKVLAPLVGLGGGLVPLVAGVEALLGSAMTFGMGLKIAAFVLFIAGYGLAAYALVENRYFSGMVRIQTDRDHRVVSGGPYRWMRHPGYAGALLSYVVTPLLLDSVWAFLPAVLLSAVLVMRTALEDRTLKAELPGYREYAGQVRFRLLPGMW